MKTENEDLTFIGTDPGAVKFGNFINYYSFHDTKQRTNNLHPQMFLTPETEPFLCLDIGCNTGDLSKELLAYLETVYPQSNIHMLAIDIDPTLIDRAQETNSNSNITFMTSNIMIKDDHQVIENFLKSHKKESFDTTFCFSVTMWIHLNNGDVGLMEFIKYIQKISRTIVIEPQPWKCYRNAQRRVKKSGSEFPLYENLKIRSNVDEVIENILTESKLFGKVYESPNSSWQRKIQSYHRLL